MKLMFVQMNMAAVDDPKSKAEMENAFEISKACPGAGLPKSKEDVKAHMDANKDKLMGAKDKAKDVSKEDIEGLVGKNLTDLMATTSGAFLPTPLSCLVATVL